MNKIKYLIWLFVITLWPVKERGLSSFIFTIPEIVRESVSENLSDLSEKSPERVAASLRDDWKNMYIWMNHYSWHYKQFKRWASMHHEDYWKLIENYPYQGRYCCFWDMLWGEKCDLLKEDNNFTEILLISQPERRINSFVQGYFVHLQLKLAKAKRENVELQEEQWIRPCLLLLQYKSKVFLRLIAQEPTLSIVLLGQSNMEVFKHWLKTSPMSLYIWIETHWQEFKEIVSQTKWNYRLWKILLSADRDWILNNKAFIVDIIRCNNEQLCSDKNYKVFMAKFANFLD